jgi:hypothetical protein
MNPIVEFVAADSQGVITKETWRATKMACPRCGNKQVNVWALVSEPPITIMGAESRIFLCISCLHVCVGLNGFEAGFDRERRAQEIIALGFKSDEEVLEVPRVQEL